MLAAEFSIADCDLLCSWLSGTAQTRDVLNLGDFASRRMQTLTDDDFYD